MKKIIPSSIIDDYCYHVTSCVDRIRFFLPSDIRSNVMGQYRTDAVDRIGTSLMQIKYLFTVIK